jgi:Transposase DDE domain
LAYRKRWKIEVFFKYMKTQGFHLEAFKMAGPHKVNILMSLLAIVYLIVIELETIEKAKLEAVETAKKAKLEALETDRSEAEKVQVAAQRAAAQLKLEAQAAAQLAAAQLQLNAQATVKLAAQKAKLKAENKAQLKAEKGHLEMERKAKLKKIETTQLEKQYQWRLQKAQEKLELEYQPKLEAAFSQLKIEKEAKLVAQKAKLETNHSNLIYKNGKSYPRKSDVIIGRSALAKIRVFQGFLDLCTQIAEKIISKTLFLKQLYINKSYA